MPGSCQIVRQVEGESCACAATPLHQKQGGVVAELVLVVLEQVAHDPSHRLWCRQPAREVAEVIVEALSADPLPFRWQTSAGARAFVSAKLADLDGSAVQAVTRTWVGG